jgi:hypothetical protein
MASSFTNAKDKGSSIHLIAGAIRRLIGTPSRNRRKMVRSLGGDDKNDTISSW